MKRILSVFLCVTMLLSMVAVSATAWSFEEADELITNTNEMSFSLNKDVYAPGDKVVITATMDSIWGDPELEGDIPGYEELVLPNAYGMDLFTACLVFPLDVFTPSAGKDFKGKSDIIGYNDTDMYEGITITKTGLSDAKAGGYYTFLVKCSTFNVDEDQYGSFNGSGDLCQWNLTISPDAKSGTYKLPIGPYCITDYETGAEMGLAPKYEFFGQWYADIGNSDTLLYDRDVNYNSPTGEQVNDDATNGGYITIVIDDGTTPVEPEPPVEEDPMSFEFAADDAEHVAGDIVEVKLSVKDNEGIDAAVASSKFSFDNTALKLIEITSPIFGETHLNYDAINAQGKYEDLGKLTTVDAYFDGSASYDEDGVIATLKFEVLPTAAGDAAVVTGSSNEDYAYPDATIKLAAKHAHDFTETIVPADCTNNGYTTTACDCGLSYITATETKLGHTLSTDPKDTVTVAPTCTDKGYTVTYCSVCRKNANTTYTDALGHDWENIVSEVSCLDDGFTMKKCKTCGTEEDKVITATAHAHKNPDGSDAYGEDYVAVKPTTNSVGYIGKDCSLCGDTWKHTEIPMLEIMWGDNNMDGKINLTDVSVLLKHIAKYKNLYISLDNADVTHDGRINTLDASKLLKYIAKWNVDLSTGSNQLG